MERPDWSHFDVMAMKRIAFIQSSNVDKIVDAEELPIQLCNYVDVYYNDRITDELAFSAGSATPREIEKFKLRPCDVVITKDSETPGDIAIPAFVDESAAGVVCGYHLAILRAHAAVMRGDFLFWCLQSRPVKEAFSTRAQGITRFGLTLDGIGTVPVPTPDLKTQKAIADFLDRETARIDQLIEKKQLLVALLKEREANKVRFEIEQLVGDTYRSIRTWKLSHVCVIRRGRFNHRPRNAPELYGGKAPFLQTGDVAQARKFITSHKQSLTELGEAVSARFPAQTVLMAIAANVGDVAISTFDAYCPDSVVGFTPTKIVNSEYLYYALRAVRSSIASSSTSNAQDNTNIARLGALRIPVPPPEQQLAIVKQFDAAETATYRISAKVHKSIDRLHEFRAALITAAVTGQIDIATLGKRGTTDRRLDAIEADMARAAQSERQQVRA